MITPHGLRVHTKGLNMEKIKSDLTLKHEGKYGDIVCRLWHDLDEGRQIMLPRFYDVPALPDRIPVKFGKVCRQAFPSAPKLHENQAILLTHLMDNVYSPKMLAAGRASCTLNLRAGLGKTYVAAALIARLGLRTLVIVPNTALKKQVTDDLTAVLGECPTIVVVNTACKWTSEQFAEYSLIVIDEIHGMCSESRRAIFWKCGTWAMLGLSATTDERADGFDPIYRLHMGPIIHANDVPGFDAADDAFSLQVRAIYYYGPDEYTQNLKHESTGSIFCPYMYEQFADDPERTELAACEILNLFAAGHCIYVFSTNVRALELMRDRLAPHIDKDKIDLFCGGSTAAHIEHVRETSRIILATYSYAGTGVSITKMTAAVFLTPRKTGLVQICARIMRRGGDTSITRIIVDIIDARTALNGQFNYRCEAYDFYDATITRHVIKNMKKHE
jgi:superfamily II DNA or RNA helicase